MDGMAGQIIYLANSCTGEMPTQTPNGNLGKIPFPNSIPIPDTPQGWNGNGTQHKGYLHHGPKGFFGGMSTSVCTSWPHDTQSKDNRLTTLL